VINVTPSQLESGQVLNLAKLFEDNGVTRIDSSSNSRSSNGSMEARYDIEQHKVKRLILLITVLMCFVLMSSVWIVVRSH
jgi:hypothetical protein